MILSSDEDENKHMLKHLEYISMSENVQKMLSIFYVSWPFIDFDEIK